jgi:hypothetical protein
MKSVFSIQVLKNKSDGKYCAEVEFTDGTRTTHHLTPDQAQLLRDNNQIVLKIKNQNYLIKYHKAERSLR